MIQGLLPRGSAWVGPREWKWPNRYTKPLEAVNLAYEVGHYHYTSTRNGGNATFGPRLCGPCIALKAVTGRSCQTRDTSPDVHVDCAAHA